MKKSISIRFVLVTTALLASASLVVLPFTASAHNGVDHEAEARVEKMETIVELLEQLRDLLAMQVEMKGLTPVTYSDEHHMHDDDHDMDLSGIHIMADGSVMLGNGEVLHDATVNDEGMIVLADGTEVEPVMDMRSDDDHDHEDEEEGVSMHIEIHDGMTHVHYTNEDGEYTEFFVDADIEDEDAVISATAEETGLDEDTVRALIDFDEVIVWD